MQTTQLTYTTSAPWGGLGNWKAHFTLLNGFLDFPFEVLSLSVCVCVETKGPLGSSSSEPANRESGSTHGSTHIKTNVQLPLHNSKRETGEVKRGFDLGTPKTHFFLGYPLVLKKVTLGV